MRVIDGSSLPWESAGNPGLKMKTVRRDDAGGSFLGLIAFEPWTATGVHQHLGTAFSLMLAGGLTDYVGTAGTGEMGINFLGSTHDAIAYMPSLMVSRLEGPVVYGPDISHSLHAGAVRRSVENAFPDMPPDCNLKLSAIKPMPTWMPGVERRMIFDYLPTGDHRRLVDFMLLPGASVRAHRLSALVEIYVIAGDLCVSSGRDALATAGSFVIGEPGDEIALRSRHGTHLLVWADGPASWLDAHEGPDFYGFDASFASPRGLNR